jgi:hypothetical protein
MKPAQATELLPALAPRADVPAPPTVGAVAIQSLIERAVDAKAAVEVVQQLRAMWREDQADRAKREFDEALSAFQSECAPILKEKGVPDRTGKVAYRYAPLEAIEVQIRPLLRKHGFSHTFDMTGEETGWITAVCLVPHKARREANVSAAA